MNPTVQRRVDALCEQLAERFPVLDRRRRRPLKVGIYHDLCAACPDVPHYLLRKVLARYIYHTRYFTVLEAGGPRHDLNGLPCGEVTAEQQQWAAVQRRERQAAYRQRRQRAARAAARPEPVAPEPPSPEPVAAEATRRPILTLKARRRGHSVPAAAPPSRARADGSL